MNASLPIRMGPTLFDVVPSSATEETYEASNVRYLYAAGSELYSYIMLSYRNISTNESVAARRSEPWGLNASLPIRMDRPFQPRHEGRKSHTAFGTGNDCEKSFTLRRSSGTDIESSHVDRFRVERSLNQTGTSVSPHSAGAGILRIREDETYAHPRQDAVVQKLVPVIRFADLFKA
jgi:hypothetical protein